MKDKKTPYIVAVRIRSKVVMVEFGTKKYMNEFIKDLKQNYSKSEYLISEPKKKKRG